EKANYYKINRKWQGKQVFYTMKRNFSGWVEKILGEYTPVKTGGSVAHSMVDLAYKLGCDPIVIIGQDLAYENYKSHASGLRKGEINLEKDKHLFPVKGIDGKIVYTDKRFKSFIDYFENYFDKRTNRTFIDATEGGAKIEHTKIINLKDAIKKYCQPYDQINVKSRLEDIYYHNLNNVTKIESELQSHIKETYKELNEAISITKKQLIFLAKAEKRLKVDNNISENDIKKLLTKVKNFEKEYSKFDYIKYFIQRILIIETLKFNEVKSKYYINYEQKVKEKLKYYRSYRVRFLQELEISKKIFKQLINNNEICGPIKIPLKEKT
ncbi:MAG: 6-hydroxymethylpterin diphosphokinase MptE-like protein, partial [Candidatus Woesearchaeota archaeon]